MKIEKQPCHGTCEKCGAECINSQPLPYLTYTPPPPELTNRGRIAAMALQGMLANGDANGHLADYAKRAVLAADYLIAELNEPTANNSKE